MKHLTIILAFIMTLSSPVAAQDSDNPAVLTGKVTHVRDGDTIEMNGIAVRLSALEGCVCVFCWKTADLTCLNRLNAALDEWHSGEDIYDYI